RVLNFCALWKKQTTSPSLAYAGIPYQVLGERAASRTRLGRGGVGRRRGPASQRAFSVGPPPNVLMKIALRRLDDSAAGAEAGWVGPRPWVQLAWQNRCATPTTGWSSARLPTADRGRRPRAGRVAIPAPLRAAGPDRVGCGCAARPPGG